MSVLTSVVLTTVVPTTSVPTPSVPTTPVPTTPVPTVSALTTRPPESTPQNLPIPRNLRKINATQSSITVRFEIPPESSETYTHFNIKYQKMTVTDFGTVPAIIGEEKERFNVNRDDIETFRIDGGPLFSERVFEDLTAGRLYEVSVQTMKVVKGRKNKDSSDKIVGENLIYVRTLPRQPKDLSISPVNNNPNKIKIIWQNLATSITGPIFDGVMLRWGEPDSDDSIKYPEQKSFIHSPPTIGMSPVGERMSYELDNLDLGNSFRFQVYSFSGEAGEADEKTKSAILTKDYSVGFLGPFDVKKVSATETELRLSFVGQPITGVTRYEITYQGIFSNTTLTMKYNSTILAKIDYSKIQKETLPVRDILEPLDEFEQNQFESDGLINRDSRQSIQFSETKNDLPREFFNVTDLTPGMLYTFEIRAVRNLDMFSEPTFNLFRTLPALPTNFTTMEVDNRNILFDFTPASTGIFTRYEVSQSIFDSNSNTYLNSTIPTTFFDIQTKNLTGTGLRPGALYRFNVTVYSEEGSVVDATRQTYSFEERTIPNSPSGATVESTVGSIHLKWIAPTGMAQDNSYQYKIAYNIVKPLIDEKNVPKNLYKAKTLWSSGSNGATRREDFLTDLKSGRLYEISIFTVAGSKKDSVRTSDGLGPLRTFTQPDYPVFLNTFQVTAKHLKIKWKPPESEGGRFDGYILRINRRREPRATVMFDAENYEFNFEAGVSDYLLEATPGAVYKMTLTTMVRFGDEVFESILIAANKLDEVEVWSPYQSHLPFPVQKCENHKIQLGKKEHLLELTS